MSSIRAGTSPHHLLYIMSTLKVNAYANFEKGGQKKEHHYELGSLPDDYIDIKITHSGITHTPLFCIVTHFMHLGVCYTDIAIANFEFHPVPLPLVGGHEVCVHSLLSSYVLQHKTLQCFSPSSNHITRKYFTPHNHVSHSTEGGWSCPCCRKGHQEC